MITDRVRLVEPLASGGMGDVWVADHLTLEMRVAAKFIRPELVERDPDLLERFNREAKAAAQIKSPNVVQIFDHGVTRNGTPYIVMELLDGNSLAEWIALVEKMSLREVSSVVTQVASVLDKSHALGIVHRDIKPDNIFLVDDEQDVFVKLLDFGIAKRVDEPLSRRVTATGMAVGTPHYMSPEQIMSAKDVDPSADCWALAVVAYEMLTGQVPFDGETLGAVAVAVNSGKLVPVRSFLPKGAPSSLDDWFERALSRYPEQRFRSARAMAEALRDIVANPALASQKAPAAPAHKVGADKTTLPTLKTPGGRHRLALAETEVPMKPAPPPRRAAAAPPEPAPRRQPQPPPAAHRRQHSSTPRDEAPISMRLDDDQGGRRRRSLGKGRRPARGGFTSQDDRPTETRSHRNLLLAAAAVVSANLLLPFLEPLGRGHLEDLIGGSTAIVLAVVAVSLFVGGAKLWDVGSSYSTWLWLSGGGMLTMGAGFAINAGSLAAPGLGLDAYNGTIVIAGSLGAAAVPFGLAVFGVQLGFREVSEGHDRAYGLVVLLIALVGFGAAYHLARRPIRELLSRPASRAATPRPASSTVDSPAPGLYVSWSVRDVTVTPAAQAPVAQLDRASDFESEGRPFESGRAY